MIIGIPKEIKQDEFRVGALPSGAANLVRQGHQVLVEAGAALGIGHSDDEYRQAGCQVLSHAAEVWSKAELIYKVKEPQPSEYPLLKSGQVVFTYFHFAASKELTEALLKAGVVAVAYETIRADHELPCLVPMSEIAGRMSVQEGAKCLEKVSNGQGILLAGVPGVSPAEVVVLGGGIVGANAARIAAGLGARVTVLDISLPRLRQLEDVMPANVRTLYSSPENILKKVLEADLVIGAVLLEGARAPRLVTREMVSRMKKGAAVVDVAIDQGGCFETGKPTTHSNPTYIVDGVVHYCVANMPGGVARTSTLALANATLPYAQALAGLGWKAAMRKDAGLLHGLNLASGKVTHQGVANAFGYAFTPPENLIQ
jgi:alanine dehydrogenase